MKRSRFETTDASTYQLLLEKAQEHRKNPTAAEAVLWKFLSKGQMGYHFRRQHPVYGYIPDFVCLKNRLIIEIDGGYHHEGEQPEKDAERTRYLEQEGYQVLRFTNEEVLNDTEEVLCEISSELKQATLPSRREEPEVGFRVGFGFDVHRLAEGRELWLGGIKLSPLPSGGAGGGFLGLLGHSDADVLIHAICDALLGAANLRDIGHHFPDTAADTLDIDSKIILRKTVELLRKNGYEVGNIDATVCAERPKLNPHIPQMQQTMAEVMSISASQISIKATTTERLGFTGREEGISAYAVALIVKNDA